MLSPQQKKLKRKRLNDNDDEILAQHDSDSDEEVRTTATDSGVTDAWARFLLIESEDEDKPLSKVSPFAINKWLQSISTSGFQSIKKLRSGAILVDCANERASRFLRSLKDPAIIQVPVKVKVHSTLNSSKGVIKCRDLQGIPEIDIRKELESEGVMDVHRVTISRESGKIETNTLFLTFATPNPPASIKIGFLRVPVTPYVPSPLRCFKCQKYNHTSKTCRYSETCRNCAQAKHDGKCVQPAKCVNCEGNHPASSKECPVWIRECEIQKVKSEKKCSFSEAKRLVCGNPAESERSYAQRAASAMPAGFSLSPSSVSALEKVLDKFLSPLMERLTVLEDLMASLVKRGVAQSEPPSSQSGAADVRSQVSPSPTPASSSSGQFMSESEVNVSSASSKP